MSGPFAARAANGPIFRSRRASAARKASLPHATHEAQRKYSVAN